MEYSLQNVSCQWKHGTDRDFYDRQPIIINSDEELQNYISCSDDGNYPAIDFTKYSMILVCGLALHQVIPDHISLYQFSTGYVLNVNLKPYDLAVVQKWQSAIIVDKLAEETIIELKITEYFYC